MKSRVVFGQNASDFSVTLMNTYELLEISMNLAMKKDLNLSLNLPRKNNDGD